MKIKENNQSKIVIETQEGDIQLDIRFDGVVHYRKVNNGEAVDSADADDIEYTCIPDINDLIKLLQEAKQIATNHFQNEYWKS